MIAIVIQVYDYYHYIIDVIDISQTSLFKLSLLKNEISIFPIFILFFFVHIQITGINRLASLYGRPNASEKQPYISPK